MTATLYKGSTSSFEAAQSAAVYEAVLTELGATGTIVPLGDPTYRTAATTNTCAAGITGLPTAVFTASEAPESFDTPPTRQGICPVFDLNGSDEEFNTPDNAYWTGGNGSADNPMSMGMWAKLDAVSNNDLMCKYLSSHTEWILFIDSSSKLRLFLTDASATANEFRTSTASVVVGQWTHLAATYDASEDSDGIHTYINGVLSDGAATSDDEGTYVAMEDKDSQVTIGNRDGGSRWVNGKIAGGALGPIHTNIELSAAQVAHLYRLGRQALEL